jgi:hypothetical protein
MTNVVSHVALDKVIRGFFTNVPALERAIHAYIERNNADPKPFVSTNPRTTSSATSTVAGRL